jgi:hypothetical protein
MSEKVLGFNGKGVKEVLCLGADNKCKELKLVPVVSVEWLEEWVEEHKFRDKQVTDLILGLELLSAVHRQAKAVK